MWVETYFLHAALSVAAAGGDRRLLAAAERDATRLERSRAGWAIVLARAIQAAVAVRRGDRSTALTRIEQAETLATSEDLAMIAAACRRRRGELLGGSEGESLVAAADADMRVRGVVNPARMANAWAPGFPS